MLYSVIVRNAKNKIITEINAFKSFDDAQQYCDIMNAVAMFTNANRFYEVVNYNLPIITRCKF